mmetsp:Transcript_2607/g.3933  ORF Transcript_2607/g.3933 Transcript_2607/m.3933 type:complete len:213 (+) Transcript_2607:54-692(+)|eukprot:CAMPEP_0185017574 /NCGR_PEP_ID=MMETSP1103-20130426/510_1 /TAXON_ID=36769 /ORGANISM="Paraphysomonas bandaiensis, Strain Caron Lab Isolate" /LENGTH=212 /DNA_ID=CAMNT_0027547045 /DNA_START=50 /DNA_END=688 /DNA_ORIENTATION=-
MVSIAQPFLGYNVRVTSAAGDDFFVNSPSLHATDVRKRIECKFPGVEITKMSNGTMDLLSQESGAIDESASVEIEYLLAGGGFQVITKLPDAINIHLLCYKCGLKDFPNFKSDWLCEGVCCCIFNNCGLNECLQCQLCCLDIGKLTSPSFKLNTSVPDCCALNVLCVKCGCKNLPNFMSEDFVVEKCLCFHSECGFGDMFKDCQLCCLSLKC